MADKILSSNQSCDCCGSTKWRYAFTENGLDLGQCEECGLYYVSPMPARDNRVDEIVEGRFATKEVASSDIHLGSEIFRSAPFLEYVELASSAGVPEGKWLDIGCGTGTLITVAQQQGFECEGIELNISRRSIAAERTDVPIHEQPLEDLDIAPGSYAVISLVDVFSHLTSPRRTFHAINKALKSGGLLLLQTGEVGPGAQLHHSFAWSLGDHLYFLGPDTISRYAREHGFEVISRNREWEPAQAYTRDRLSLSGSSRNRNLIKKVLLAVPGAFSLFRWFMLNRRQIDNPIFSSTILLRRI